MNLVLIGWVLLNENQAKIIIDTFSLRILNVLLKPGTNTLTTQGIYIWALKCMKFTENRGGKDQKNNWYGFMLKLFSCSFPIILLIILMYTSK